MADGTQGPARSTAVRAVDVALVLAVVVLLAFPLLSRAQAATLPLTPPDPTTALPPLQADPAPPLQPLPAFADTATEEHVGSEQTLSDPTVLHAAVTDAVAAALPPAGATRLLQIAGDADLGVNENALTRGNEFEVEYPFRYPDVDPVVDAALPGELAPEQVTAVNDAAAALILGTAYARDLLPNGAAVAYALLDRARSGDECLPQLNLAFLLATDVNPRDDITADELERAAQRCPGDPTPLWVLGQFQSHRAPVAAQYFDSQEPDLEDRQSRPFATFGRLQRELPGAHAGWSGEADAHLRLGYQLLAERQPFSARNRFRRARALYERALELDDDAGLRAGLARASAGLREHDAAVTQQQAALAGRDHAEHEVRLVEYLERAGRYDEAAQLGGEFLRDPVDESPRRGLFGRGFPRPVDADPLADEDAHDPVSWGTARLRGVHFALSPSFGGAGAAVLDLAFIPDFRPQPGVTGHDRWCREWSWRRDLVVAGRYAEALDGFPSAFTTDRPGGFDDICSTLFNASPNLVAAVAAEESGDHEAAIGWVRADPDLDLSAYPDDDGEQALLFDTRLILRRFAGQLDRALEITDEWLAATPRSRLALDRRGEIAFLQQRYDEAAGYFSQAADAAAAALPQAESQLKTGAALILAGRTDEARPLLDSASALAAEDAVPTDEALYGDLAAAGRYLTATFVTYYAAVQTGDLHLRDRRYAEATSAYSNALAVIAQVTETFPDALAELPWRPEVVHNNLALAYISDGQAQSAGAAADQAVAGDPANPIFLQTRAFAQQETGDLEGAAHGYTAALEADPTLFSAANDLGAVRFGQGRTDDAVRAFRQAVGANPGYPLGWFNLGVALDRLGPAHVLRSQAAYARAARLDPSLRESDREIVFDNEPYFTTLDLSRPLPAQWQFATSYERAPLGVAGGVLVLVLLRLVLALVREHGAGVAAERLLDVQRRNRFLTALNARTWGWVAIAASVVVLLWPAVSSTGTSPTERLVLGGAALVISLLYVRSRVVWSRLHRAELVHRTWPAALLLAAATTGVGAGWAPMPVAEPAVTVRRLPLIGPIVVGVVAVALVVLGRLTEVPLTRAMGAGGLTLAASLLLPVHPYDGAAMSARAAVAMDALFLGVVALMFFGVL